MRRSRSKKKKKTRFFTCISTAVTDFRYRFCCTLIHRFQLYDVLLQGLRKVGVRVEGPGDGDGGAGMRCIIF